MSKILSLSADNFKRLRAIEIKPKGDIVEISGRNAAGKSSVLDAIQAAIGGGKAMPAEALRRGANRGEIKLDLGDIVVTRSITKGGGSLKVTAKDGSDIKSPQTVLDKLFGALTFDPLAFARMKPAEQVSSLMRVAGLEEEFARLAKERADAEGLRRDAGRDVDRLKAQLQAVPEVDGPDEETSASDIMARFKAATDQNAKNAEDRKWLAGKRSDEEKQLDKIAELEKELAQYRSSLEVTRGEIAAEAADIEALKDTDTKAIQAELDSLESTNQRARTRKSRRSIESQLELATTKHREQERRIERIAEEREQRIAASNLPVKGLRFTDDGLTFNNVPFAQASASEQIRVSAMLGMAQHNELRVMLIRDGSLLDDDALAELTKIAQKYDTQVWIERVADPSDGIGIVIEDGEVFTPARAETANVGGAA